MKKKYILIIVVILILLVIAGIFGYIKLRLPKENETAAVKLYKNLIDKQLKNIKNYSYLAIDTNNLIDPLSNKKLSENSKNEILNYLKKYNETIYDKNIQKLKEDGLASNEVLNNGYFIRIEVLKSKNGRATVLLGYYTGNLSSGGEEYYIVYSIKNNEWDFDNMKITNKFIS